jgi:CLIP-associating protein 1/2
LTAEQLTPRLTPPAVLEEKPVNEDAANLVARQNGDGSDQPDISSDKAKQHARLIESALAKIKAKTLDVHGFRKLQSILRDNKAPLSDEKFEALLLGLFDYLEDPQSNLAPEKVQDVKAQNLATVKLLLKKYRDHFQPHISKGLESLMSARAVYDARTHIVSGLELLADELVSLGDAQEIATVLTRRMTDTAVDSAAGWRSLSMGLHVLKEMVDAKAEYVPTDQELGSMAALCTRCLESTESGVRMDAVQLCVALQGRVGDARFWDVMSGVKDDPKSLITYYIVKRQREKEAASGVA